MTVRLAAAAFAAMCLAAVCAAEDRSARSDETEARLTNLAPPEDAADEADAAASDSAPETAGALPDASGVAPEGDVALGVPDTQAVPAVTPVDAQPALATQPVADAAPAKPDAAPAAPPAAQPVAAAPSAPAKEPPVDWALYVIGAGVVLALIVGMVRGARDVPE